MIEYAILGGAVFATGAVAISTFKVFKVVPYAYSNARIRALKSDLVSDEELLKYCELDYNEIIYDISKKEGYKYFVELTKGQLDIEAVESALRQNLSRIMKKVYSLSPDSLKEYIKTHLMFNEVKNIQTFLRFQKGLLEGVPSDFSMLENLMIETRTLSKDDWLKIIRLPLKDFVNKLKGRSYHPILEKHIKQVSNDNYDFDLSALNSELDEFCFYRMRKQSKDQASRQLTKSVIDSHNIRRAFDYNKFEVYRGGLLDKEFFNDIDSFEKLKSALLKTNYQKIAEKSLDEETLEMNLEKHLKKLAGDLMKKDPLSANSIVGFISLKLFEIKNLRALLILKNSGFSSREIKENLILNYD